MSAESLRARLDAVDALKEKPTLARVIQSEWVTTEESDVLAHAPTDLRLALDVIEAAKRYIELQHREDNAGRIDAGMARRDLREALDAFEAES
jgi:hypothetical protein